MPTSAGSLPSQSAGLTLEIKRVVRARRSVVFRAFSDPDELAKWWGPEGFSTPSLELHARVGARYRIEMQPPEGAPLLPERGVPRGRPARSPRLHVRLGRP